MMSDLHAARGRIPWAINAYQRHTLGKMFFTNLEEWTIPKGSDELVAPSSSSTDGASVE
jgi:hypothetical protein